MAELYVFTGSRDSRLERFPSVRDGIQRWCREAMEDGCRVLVGDCPTGIDAIVRHACYEYDKLEVFAADWGTHGKAAGPIRNASMMQHAMDSGDDVLVVATTCGDSRGTRSAIMEARKRGLRVTERHVMEEKLHGY